MQTESFSGGKICIVVCFSKESGEKFYGLPSLLILLFIAVSFQSTDSCGCEWLGNCRVFFSIR